MTVLLSCCEMPADSHLPRIHIALAYTFWCSLSDSYCRLPWVSTGNPCILLFQECYSKSVMLNILMISFSFSKYRNFNSLWEFHTCISCSPFLFLSHASHHPLPSEIRIYIISCALSPLSFAHIFMCVRSVSGACLSSQISHP